MKILDFLAKELQPAYHFLIFLMLKTHSLLALWKSKTKKQLTWHRAPEYGNGQEQLNPGGVGRVAQTPEFIQGFVEHALNC